MWAALLRALLTYIAVKMCKSRLTEYNCFVIVFCNPCNVLRPPGIIKVKRGHGWILRRSTMSTSK